MSEPALAPSPVYFLDELGDNLGKYLWRDGDGLITAYGEDSEEDGEQKIKSLPVQLAARLFAKSDKIKQRLTEGANQTIVVAGGGGRDAQQGMFATMSAVRCWLEQTIPRYSEMDRPASSGKIIIEIYSTEFLNSNDERGENFMEWTELIKNKKTTVDAMGTIFPQLSMNKNTTVEEDATGTTNGDTSDDVTAEHSTFLALFKDTMRGWAEVRVKNFPIHGSNGRFGEACLQLKSEIHAVGKEIISALLFETGADMQLTLRAVFRVDNIDDTMMLQLFHRWLPKDVNIAYTLCNTFVDYKAWPTVQKITKVGEGEIASTYFYFPTAHALCTELRESRVWERHDEMQQISSAVETNWSLRFMLHEWEVEAKSGRNGVVDVSVMNEAALCFACGKSAINPVYITSDFDREKLDQSPHKYYFDKAFETAARIACARGADGATDDDVMQSMTYADIVAGVVFLRLTETDDANLPRPPESVLPDPSSKDSKVQVKIFELLSKAQIYIGCYAYYRAAELIRRRHGEEPSTQAWRNFLSNAATVSSCVANARVRGLPTYQLPGSRDAEGVFQSFPQIATAKQWGASCFDTMLWVMYLGHDEAVARLLEWQANSDQYLAEPREGTGDGDVIRANLRVLQEFAGTVKELAAGEDVCPLAHALEGAGAGGGSEGNRLVTRRGEHECILGDIQNSSAIKIFTGGRGEGWSGDRMQLLSSWQQYDALAISIADEYTEKRNSMGERQV
jgi:hypothetical protein